MAELKGIQDPLSSSDCPRFLPMSQLRGPLHVTSTVIVPSVTQEASDTTGVAPMVRSLREAPILRRGHP